jgi:two-component system, NarL family, sensor histidine kinase DesK
MLTTPPPTRLEGNDGSVTNVPSRQSTSPDSAGPAGGRIWIAIAFAWLVFLAIPGSDVLATGSAVERAGATMGVVGFLVVYGWFWLRVRRRRDSPGAQVAVIALASIATSLVLSAPGRWWSLFIYVVVVAGAGSPPRRAAAAVGGVALLVAAVSWLEQQDGTFIALAALWAGLIGAGCLAITQLITTNVELRLARREITRLAVSDERLRFARDLHDVLGHSLSLIVIKAGLAVRMAGVGDTRAPGEMADVEQVALRALQQVREAVTAYRRPTLREELPECEHLLGVAGIRLVVMGTVDGLPDHVDAVLAWAVREGVTNVVRHARASRCSIDVRREREAVRLEVADDGRGACRVHGTSGVVEGNGLRGLRERLTALSGELEARALPDGFVLTVSIPAGGPGPAS